MTAQHTPGPVFLTDHGSIGTGDPQKFDRLKIHSPWVEDAWDGDAEADANMRRLVACWNACEGIDTEDLEAASTSIIEKLHDQAAKAVLAQRDELLAALQVVLRDYAAVHDIGDIEMQPAIYQARAVIQKATRAQA